MSLIEKLKAGTRNIKTLKFPGAEDDIVLKVLSNADIQEAVFAAERRFKDEEIIVSDSTRDAYGDERTTQILFRALRDPRDIKKPLFSSADELRKLLTKEEKEALACEYDAFQQECAPQLDKMTDKEFDELWEALKKNPETVSSFLSSGVQKRLLLYLAARQSTLPTDSGSTS
jgi:hypothetical protein